MLNVSTGITMSHRPIPVKKLILFVKLLIQLMEIVKLVILGLFFRGLNVSLDESVRNDQSWNYYYHYINYHWINCWVAFGFVFSKCCFWVVICLLFRLSLYLSMKIYQVVWIRHWGWKHYFISIFWRQICLKLMSFVPIYHSAMVWRFGFLKNMLIFIAIFSEVYSFVFTSKRSQLWVDLFRCLWPWSHFYLTHSSILVSQCIFPSLSSFILFIAIFLQVFSNC